MEYLTSPDLVHRRQPTALDEALKPIAADAREAIGNKLGAVAKYLEAADAGLPKPVFGSNSENVGRGSFGGKGGPRRERLPYVSEPLVPLRRVTGILPVRDGRHPFIHEREKSYRDELVVRRVLLATG